MSRKRPPETAKIQYRTSLDVRANEDEAGFDGHAASWWSIDSYGTAMAPGAFKKTIQERRDRIPVLWNHNYDAPVGKHLDLKEDDAGLYINVGIADDGAEGTVLMKRLRYGVPLGLSFGFETIRSRPAEESDPLDWSQAPEFFKSPEGREYVRVIEEVRYWESSPVTFPANTDSTIDDIRSAHMEQQADYITSLLEDLRSAALTIDDARLPLLHDLVAVYQERAAAGAFTATTAPDSKKTRRRNHYAEYQLLVVNAGIGE